MNLYEVKKQLSSIRFSVKNSCAKHLTKKKAASFETAFG
jgi:hypothetical protein